MILFTSTIIYCMKTCRKKIFNDFSRGCLIPVKKTTSCGAYLVTILKTLFDTSKIVPKQDLRLSSFHVYVVDCERNNYLSINI